MAWAWGLCYTHPKSTRRGENLLKNTDGTLREVLVKLTDILGIDFWILLFLLKDHEKMLIGNHKSVSVKIRSTSGVQVPFGTQR